MVLTNAVYFKGFWKYPFNPQRTHKDNFFINPKAALQVDMMSQTGISNMVIGLGEASRPGAGDALQGRRRVHGGAPPAKWESQGGGQAGPTPEAQETRVSVLKAMPSVPVRVKFPKIIVESALEDELISTLKNMGIRDLFSSAADLTDFTHVRGLMVNGAIHKALIEVDEEGAEAAAATVLVMTKSSMTPKTTFTCNRPFVFYIKDNEANNILFMGVYRETEIIKPESHQPDTAAYINAFFSAETRGKIPNIIQPSFLGGAKMVLTNAVYFKGIWKYPFKSQSTHKEKFFWTRRSFAPTCWRFEMSYRRPWWCSSRDVEGDPRRLNGWSDA
nr:serpin B4-like [Penaeus vannamei]